MAQFTHDIPNIRTFEVTRIPWTNTKPTRIKIKDHRNAVWVVITGDNYKDAVEYLKGRGFTIAFKSEGYNRAMLFHTTDFQTTLK